MVTEYKLNSIFKAIYLAGTVLVTTGVLTQNVYADGTERLDAPGIGIESGSGIVTGGVGLQGQSGALKINVPGGASIRQSLLYWVGRGETGDSTIVVNGNSITGTLIGGPTNNPVDPSRSYRADITSLDLINPGSNTLSVSGLDFGPRPPNGAGAVVIYDEQSAIAFGGRAIAVDATVGPNTATAVDTGELPSGGGTLSPDTINSTNVSGLVRVETVSASASGSGSQSESTSSVENMDASLAGVGISADALSSEAIAQCSANGANVMGSSKFANLRVGDLINLPISFEPNTVLINLLGIKVVANEQIVTGDDDERGIKVNALHVTVPPVLSLFRRAEGKDLLVASSEASIKCQASPQADISIVDGNDYAYEPLEGSLSTTLTRTFSFAPTTFDRVARLDYFVGDGEASRPDMVLIRVPGLPSRRLSDTLDSSSGSDFDADTVSVPVPAGVSEISLRILSSKGRDSLLTRLPDSLSWIMAALTVPSTQEGNLYSGQGTVLRTNVAGLSGTTVGDTGALPGSGGNLSITLNDLNASGLASSGTASASTTGAGERSDTSVIVEDLDLSVAGITIGADIIQSTASAECSSDNIASVDGGSKIANLVVNGAFVDITPGTSEIELPLGGKILINEKLTSGTGNIASLTVNALHIIVPDAKNILGDDLANVVISSSHADISCQ